MSQPSWFTENTDSSSGAANNNKADATAAPAPASTDASDATDVPYKALVKYTFIFVDIILAVLMASVGALGIQNVDSSDTDDTNTLFLGLYMILFAGILFFYEVDSSFAGHDRHPEKQSRRHRQKPLSIPDPTIPVAPFHGGTQ